MNELKEIIETIPEETQKEIYKDIAKPTLIETGKTLSLFPRVVKNALSKVEMWCINREFAVEEFKIELEKKLKAKREEDVVDADPRIFIPSAQALSYSWDQKEIKRLYINLMASDMDKNTKNQVHPSFTEIIKQMDAIDVKLFTTIYENIIFPVCAINTKSSDGSTQIILEYLLPDRFYLGSSEILIIKSLNNLERLKLINIQMDRSYTYKDNYLSIKNGIRVKKYKEELGEEFNMKEGVISKTELGKDFYNVCCK